MASIINLFTQGFDKSISPFCQTWIWDIKCTGYLFLVSHWDHYWKRSVIICREKWKSQKYESYKRRLSPSSNSLGRRNAIESNLCPGILASLPLDADQPFDIEARVVDVIERAVVYVRLRYACPLMHVSMDCLKPSRKFFDMKAYTNGLTQLFAYESKWNTILRGLRYPILR